MCVSYIAEECIVCSRRVYWTHAGLCECDVYYTCNYKNKKH